MCFCFRCSRVAATCPFSSRNAEVEVRLASPRAAAGKWLMPADRPDLMEGRLQGGGGGGDTRLEKRCEEMSREMGREIRREENTTSGEHGKHSREENMQVTVHALRKETVY